MARKKASATRSPAKNSQNPEQKPSPKSSAGRAAPKKARRSTGAAGAAETMNAQATAGMFRLDGETRALAERTLNLWREQLMQFTTEGSGRMDDFAKMMEPTFNLFTRGLDMWLMMMDSFAKNVPATDWSKGFAAATGGGFAGMPFGTTHATTSTGTQRSDAGKKSPEKSAGKTAGKKARRPAKAAAPKAAKNRPAPAGATSDDRSAAVAELAKRLTALKEQNGRTAAGHAGVPQKSATVTRLARPAAPAAAAPEQRQKRRRKA